MKTAYRSLFTFAVAIAMLILAAPARAQVVDCSVNPEQCITEDIFYPSGHGTHLFLYKGTKLQFFGAIGEAPNQRIVATYQPGLTPDTTEPRYVWVLSARATPPNFDGWARIDLGCFQFWGYGLAKRERVCLYEWQPV